MMPTTTSHRYSRARSIGLLVTSSVLFTAVLSAVILWAWATRSRFGSDTGDVIWLTAIVLTARAVVVFLATTIVLAVTPSLSDGWTKRSLLFGAIGLGATSSTILWAWTFIAPEFYAPGMSPTWLETIGFAVAGGVQCFVVKPIQSALQ